MISDYERLGVALAASVLSLIVSAMILRNARARAFPLACSTPGLTAALLGYYYYAVRDPSHGMGILILPLATGWLWWRKQNVGRPTFAQRTFILLQILLCAIYLLVVRLQES